MWYLIQIIILILYKKDIMNRIDELDILKAFGILMVVIGHTHCPPELKNMFYFIHIPLFFMISGCTNKPDTYYGEWSNVKIFLIKRIKSLYLPFLYYSIPIILLHNVFTSIGFYENAYDIKNFIHQLFRTLLFSIGENEPFLPQLWFIKVLFIMEVSYAILLYVCIKLKIRKWFLLFPISGVSISC